MAEYSAGQRAAYAKRGIAEPDGSYPIPDVSALHDAIAAYGRSKNPGRTKAHIIARAQALGSSADLPEDW